MELSPDQEIYERKIKSFSAYLADIGGIVSIARTLMISVMFILHYRGAYQDMTQRIFLREVRDGKDEAETKVGKMSQVKA